MIEITLPSPEGVADWLRTIGQRPVVIFKHSPTCGTSHQALRAFEQYLAQAEKLAADYRIVDVLDERPLSQALAKATGVRHESPQVLVLKNGACVWTASHISINESSLNRHLPNFAASTPAA
ncbi:MAG: bacillithiol system redox-active protein YtxJ [Planctomycetota bacterium]